jgi:hypothetical protein
MPLKELTLVGTTLIEVNLLNKKLKLKNENNLEA